LQARPSTLPIKRRRLVPQALRRLIPRHSWTPWTCLVSPMNASVRRPCVCVNCSVNTCLPSLGSRLEVVSWTFRLPFNFLQRRNLILVALCIPLHRKLACPSGGPDWNFVRGPRRRSLVPISRRARASRFRKDNRNAAWHGRGRGLADAQLPSNSGGPGAASDAQHFRCRGSIASRCLCLSVCLSVSACTSPCG
jgi:hypothetical protein